MYGRIKEIVNEFIDVLILLFESQIKPDFCILTTRRKKENRDSLFIHSFSIGEEGVRWQRNYKNALN